MFYQSQTKMPPKRTQKAATRENRPTGGVGNPPVSKRREVKLAEDSDEVLKKCRQLRDELRARQQQPMASATGGDGGSSDDDWDFDDDQDKKRKADVIPSGKKSVADEPSKKAKTQQMSLAELERRSTADKKAFLEVVEMNSTEVMEGIENVAVKIAQQV